MFCRYIWQCSFSFLFLLFRFLARWDGTYFTCSNPTYCQSNKPSKIVSLLNYSISWVRWAGHCLCLRFFHEDYAMICSSFRGTKTALWSLFPNSISSSRAGFLATTECVFNGSVLLFAVLLLDFLPVGRSWLCFPSYVVTTARGSVEALSTCLRTLHPA